ncbi:MAG: plasmid replication/partition related protein [Dyella sp.]
MDIVVNEQLRAYIDPLTADEHAALERSILAEGCRDALVLWGNILVDGHNRYGICQQHGLPFQTVQNTRFNAIEDVHLWMIDQHLGRRSVSDFQRGVLALRKREILAERSARATTSEHPSLPPLPPLPGAAPSASTDSDEAPIHEPAALDTREALARAARLSNNQVGLIEKIHKQAAPEVVAAVRAGTLSINAAAAVASLPTEEQRAAASAGADELKEAAKRVRESRRRPPKAKPPAPASDTLEAGDELLTLRQRVAELTAENQALRRQLAQLRGDAMTQDPDQSGPPF